MPLVDEDRMALVVGADSRDGRDGIATRSVVVVGIDESRLLRWLVRNRQQAGIRKRYREERSLQEAPAGEAAPDSPSGGTR